MSLKTTSIYLVCVLGSILPAYGQIDSTEVSTSEFSKSATDTVVSPSNTDGNQLVASDISEIGDSAYNADNFVMAEQMYLKAIEKQGASSTIFYNLGNAYYRQGYLGKAIVNYERALKFDPTNADAKTNLEFVKSKITDRQVESSSLITRLWNNLVMQFRANTWAWIGIVLFALFLSGVLVYLFSSSIMVKKFSFFGGLIVFLFCTLVIIISFDAANKLNTSKYAIILSPSAQLSTTPREARNQSEEAFVLHEGTKIEIVDSISSSAEGKWYEVIVGADNRAWIKASDVERI